MLTGGRTWKSRYLRYCNIVFDNRSARELQTLVLEESRVHDWHTFRIWKSLYTPERTLDHNAYEFVELVRLALEETIHNKRANYLADN